MLTVDIKDRVTVDLQEPILEAIITNDTVKSSISRDRPKASVSDRYQVVPWAKRINVDYTLPSSITEGLFVDVADLRTDLEDKLNGQEVALVFQQEYENTGVEQRLTTIENADYISNPELDTYVLNYDFSQSKIQAGYYSYKYTSDRTSDSVSVAPGERVLNISNDNVYEKVNATHTGSLVGVDFTDTDEWVFVGVQGSATATFQEIHDAIVQVQGASAGYLEDTQALVTETSASAQRITELEAEVGDTQTALTELDGVVAGKFKPYYGIGDLLIGMVLFVDPLGEPRSTAYRTSEGAVLSTDIVYQYLGGNLGETFNFSGVNNSGWVRTDASANHLRITRNGSGRVFRASGYKEFFTDGNHNYMGDFDTLADTDSWEKWGFISLSVAQGELTRTKVASGGSTDREYINLPSCVAGTSYTITLEASTNGTFFNLAYVNSSNVILTDIIVTDVFVMDGETSKNVSLTFTHTDGGRIRFSSNGLADVGSTSTISNVNVKETTLTTLVAHPAGQTASTLETGDIWVVVDQTTEDGLLPTLMWYAETSEWSIIEDGSMASQLQSVGWAAGASKLIKGPNGEITGWSFADGSAVNSEFAINADHFYIQNSANDIETRPFEIDSTTNEIKFKGVVEFAGLGIDSNSTSIDGQKIQTGYILADNLDTYQVPASYTGTIMDGNGVRVYQSGICVVKIGNLL